MSDAWVEEIAASAARAADPPADPLPWTEEMNDLFLRVAELAWVDLHAPDQPTVVPPRRQLADLALDWFERGAPIDYQDRHGRERSVSLLEVWGWDQGRVAQRAREVYAARATTPAHHARNHARSSLHQVAGIARRRVARRSLEERS